MRKIFLIISVLFSLSLLTYGQLNLTSYAEYAFGLSYPSSNPLCGEIKTFSNRNFNDLIIELDAFYNFPTKDYHQTSIGLGFNVYTGSNDFFNALCLPIKFRFTPLTDFKKFGIVFEVCPEYYFSDGNTNLRHIWGISYILGN